MAEGRETALRAALQVMAGREIDTPDLLAIAEWLRSGAHPAEVTPSSSSAGPPAVDWPTLFRAASARQMRIAVRDVLDNDGDMLDRGRRAALERAYRATRPATEEGS